MSGTVMAVPAEIVAQHRRTYGDEETFRLALESIAEDGPETGRAFPNHRAKVVELINIARLALQLPPIH